MRAPLPLNRRPVFWLLLPSIPLLLIVVNRSGSHAPEPGYWTWTIAHSMLWLLVPAGLAATGAALEASRLRSRSALNALNTRRAWVVTLDAGWPSYACGAAVQAIAIVVSAVRAPGGASRFPVEILITIFAVLLFHTALGFVFGALLRPTISVPLALVASYSWLGFTGTVTWAPLRHLSGLVIETCCSLDEAVSMASLASAASFSLIGAAGAFLVAAAALRLTSMPRTVTMTAGLGTVGSAVIVGLGIGWHLGYEATTPRATSALRCAPGQIEVCLYPEQLMDRRVPDQIRGMVLAVEGRGVSVPHKVVAGRGTRTPAQLFVRYEPGMTPKEVAGSLASGFQGEAELHCAEPAATTVARTHVADLVRSWLQFTMLEEARPEDIGDLSMGESDELDALLTAPTPEQVRWVNSGLAAMTSCRPVPQPYALG